MKALGLNPTETEIQDLINEVERNGFIYYPAFCRLVMRKLREDDEENFRRELFRTMVGPKKYDGVQAPIYNYGGEFLTFEQVLNCSAGYQDFREGIQNQVVFCQKVNFEQDFLNYGGPQEVQQRAGAYLTFEQVVDHPAEDHTIRKC